MKYAIVILDGAAGEPLKKFGGKTSLEQAKTPYLDQLAQGGTCGLAYNVPEGMEPSSNVACTSIMGYNPADYPIGRGAIEGASCGINLGKHQLALRVNLTHVLPNGIMHSYSCDDITTQSGNAIIEELQQLNDDMFTLHKSVSFRGILVVNNHPELMDATYYAAHNISDKNIKDYWPCGSGTKQLNDYMQRCNELLKTSSENARREELGLLRVTNVWAFWPGVRPSGMPPFSSLYGLNAAMLSPVDLLNGLAKLTNIRRYYFDGITDGPDNDYEAMGRGACQMLDENDLVFIHVENPDSEGHNGDADAKVAAIEAIDKHIVSQLIAWRDAQKLNKTGGAEELRILALPDHPTPIATKAHSGNPVPFVMNGCGIEQTSGNRLTEKEATKSGIEYKQGCKLMTALLC